MEREMETSLENLVRVGTVTWADPVKRVARVKFQDMDLPSAPLHVLEIGRASCRERVLRLV